MSPGSPASNTQRTLTEMKSPVACSSGSQVITANTSPHRQSVQMVVLSFVRTTPDFQSRDIPLVKELTSAIQRSRFFQVKMEKTATKFSSTQPPRFIPMPAETGFHLNPLSLGTTVVGC